MPQPTPLPELSDPLTAPEHSWKVILHDDDITPFELVVLALQKAAGLSIEVAEMVAYEAHTESSATVRRGLDEEDARIMCGSLKRHTGFLDNALSKTPNPAHSRHTSSHWLLLACYAHAEQDT